MVRVGVVGYGYWGPNIVRNLSEHDGFEVIAIADQDASRRQLAGRAYPNCLLVEGFEDILNIPDLQAIAICTPVSTHYEFALRAIESRLHVLVEKPICTCSRDADNLLKLADQKNVRLLVDYTFLYTGAVRKMKELLSSEDFGKLLYVDSTRINLGVYQHDVNVLWDLAIHDLSIIYHLIKERPTGIQAIGTSHTQNGIENIAYLVLHYGSGMLIHLNCSWTSPVKIRHMIIGGEKKMIIYDDIEPTDKLKIYQHVPISDSNEARRNVLVDYRLGEVRIPKFEVVEALSLMVDDFYRSISGNTPYYDPSITPDIIRILELADESIQNNGKLMEA